MIRSLWIAKTGLDAQQTQLDVISNNLANVSTAGFKRSRAVFEDLLYQTLRQPGAHIFTQGNLQKTDNPLDIAVNGQGFFQVTMPDGSLAYTRDGSLHMDSQGQIVSSSGYPLSPAITIPANAQVITVARDGTVTVTQPGQATPTQVGAIQLANFINASGLQGQGENLYVETAASGTPTTNAPGTNGLGVLQQGYVETSNVNVVEELVNMIQTQRAYEINSKAVQTSDQMLQKLTQL